MQFTILFNVSPDNGLILINCAGHDCLGGSLNCNETVIFDYPLIRRKNSLGNDSVNITGMENVIITQ